MIYIPKQTVTDNIIAFYEFALKKIRVVFLIKQRPGFSWTSLELCSGRKLKYQFIQFYVNSRGSVHSRTLSNTVTQVMIY